MKLRFKIDDNLVQIVAHALASREWSVPYEDRTQKEQPTLFLVKDEGVYVMSAGQPGNRKHPEGEDHSQHVAYAKGINPLVDSFDDWYPKARALSGDDFGTAIPAQWFSDAIKDGAEVINLEVVRTRIKASWSARKPLGVRPATADEFKP